MSSTARGRPRAFDRDAALDRAIRLFWRKGYGSTSVRDLSEELGIGQPSLYRAFGDKRALFAEAVEVYARTYGGFIDVALREEHTALGAMRRILAEAPARYTRRGLPPGCLITSGDAGAEEEVHAAMSRIRQDKTLRLRRRIEADVACGRLPHDVNASALADYLMAVLSGLVQRARDGATRQELRAISEVAAACLPSEQGLPAPASQTG